MKTRLLPLLILLGLGTAQFCHSGGLDLGSPASRTPYDPYLDPMWSVLRKLGGNQPDRSTVEKLVREGRAFRYVFRNDQPYVPQAPDVTESTKSGDCKAKSLWLASKLDSRNVRFVIGKARAVSAISHAWLIWQG